MHQKTINPSTPSMDTWLHPTFPRKRGKGINKIYKIRTLPK
jgi:hypothetical protein